MARSSDRRAGSRDRRAAPHRRAGPDAAHRRRPPTTRPTSRPTRSGRATTSTRLAHAGRPGAGCDGVTQPRLGLDRLPPLLLAPADEHEDRAVPPHAARRRGDPRLARAAAHVRPERRRPVPHRAPRPVPGARQDRRLRHLRVAVVLGRLPAAVHLADRLHRAAHEAPLRGAPRPRRRRRRRACRGWRATAPSRIRPQEARRTRRLAPAVRRRRGPRAAEARRLPHARCSATRSAPSAATCARPATSSSTPRSSACC